jgi:hypothetical protein
VSPGRAEIKEPRKGKEDQCLTGRRCTRRLGGSGRRQVVRVAVQVVVQQGEGKTRACGPWQGKTKAELGNLNWIVRAHPSEFKYMDQLLESGEERGEASC